MREDTKGVEGMNEYECLGILIGYHSKRLNTNPYIARQHLLKFAELVGIMENAGKTVGKNPTSTAKGLYQFIDGSVVPAMNRLSRTVGEHQWMRDARVHKDANQMTREQQTLMFLGDMLEKRGSDRYMGYVMGGDKEAMMNAYLVLHHTAPDEATKKRAKRIFGGS